MSGKIQSQGLTSVVLTPNLSPFRLAIIYGQKARRCWVWGELNPCWVSAQRSQLLWSHTKMSLLPPQKESESSLPPVSAQRRKVQGQVRFIGIPHCADSGAIKGTMLVHLTSQCHVSPPKTTDFGDQRKETEQLTPTYHHQSLGRTGVL